VILVMFVLPAMLAGCGSSSNASPPTSTVPVVIEVAGPNPSASAKMICSEEAKNDIASVVGIDTVRPLVPKWSDHVYSCVYAYKGGPTLTMSVKEMSSVAETTAYFDRLNTKLGRTPDPLVLGEGAFNTTNGSVVVRKDYRVLLVDVAKLPAHFGRPAFTRNAFAAAIASTIMVCWVGA
jgi:hypothetical protein